MQDYVFLFSCNHTRHSCKPFLAIAKFCLLLPCISEKGVQL